MYWLPILAKLILAERERCAHFAESEKEQHLLYMLWHSGIFQAHGGAVMTHADGTFTRTLKPFTGRVEFASWPHALLGVNGSKLLIVHMYAEILDSIPSYTVQDVQARLDLTRSLISRYARRTLCDSNLHFWTSHRMAQFSLIVRFVRRFGVGIFKPFLISERAAKRRPRRRRDPPLHPKFQKRLSEHAHSRARIFQKILPEHSRSRAT